MILSVFRHLPVVCDPDLRVWPAGKEEEEDEAEEEESEEAEIRTDNLRLSAD